MINPKVAIFLGYDGCFEAEILKRIFDVKMGESEKANTHI
jgi:hypothetical protein